MFYILLTMFAGIGAGYLFRRSRLLAHSGRAVTVIVWIMLFLLGAEVGMDENIVGSFSRLGMQALLFAAAGVAGSVVAAVIVYRTFLRADVTKESPPRGKDKGDK